MEDFRKMFPSLEVGLIESVLRSNNGAVDDTIDQLLVLSMDDQIETRKRFGAVGGIECETIPKSIDDTPVSKQLSR